jgi:hypothetical protein
MDRATLERAIAWGPAYNPAWDQDPDAYFAAGLVGWARSRRLGLLHLPAAGFKAYLGVQHVDPGRAGWDRLGLAEAEARFFVSWFDGAHCLGLRTLPTLDSARDVLWTAWSQHCAARR